MFEVLVAIVIGALVTVAVVESMWTAETLGRDTRERLRAAAEHREGRRAITNVLRTAALDTLAGFGPDDVALRPKFQRVTGMLDGDRTLGLVEELRWKPSPGPVPGVAHPGAVYLVAAGGDLRILAAHVPKDAFRVRQEGRSLVVSLTTYHVGGATESRSITSETVVSLRN